MPERIALLQRKSMLQQVLVLLLHVPGGAGNGHGHVYGYATGVSFKRIAIAK